MLYFLARNCSFTPQNPRNSSYGFIHDVSPEGVIPEDALSCQMDVDVFLNAKPDASSCGRLWIHCPARTISGQELADAMLAWPCETVPVSGDRDFLENLLAAGVPHVAIKGNESSGVVGRESLGILFSLFQGKQAKISVWGGIALPEAAAAFLATGAESIVFESVHALCGEPAPELATRIRALRITDFREIGPSLDPEGRSPGLCLRVFDRGNNSEVQALLGRERELIRSKTENAFPILEKYARDRAIALPESSLKKDELVFLGPEAAFAQHFSLRFGSDPNKALDAFVREVFSAWRGAPQKIAAAFDQDAAHSLTGCSLPFIQGAMTWITDMPELAKTIAENGALPSLALGPRSPAELQRDFSSLQEIMGDLPYAVNILVLPENPYREEQLEWIEHNRPAFVTIAAGDPAFTRRLATKGLKVLCHVQDETLLSLAHEAGAWGVILEGNEAGGHVGEQTALTLAQMAMRWRHDHPDCRPLRIILAGGIATRDAANRALLLGADLLQMGTAYLATREFVECKALSLLYQQHILRLRDTCLSGQSVGLRVRGLVTPQTQTVLDLEHEFEQKNLPLAERRRRLEEVGAGSLLLAARGLDGDGQVKDADFCLQSGQFMSGSIVCVIDTPQSLAGLHASLAHDPQSLRTPPVNATFRLPLPSQSIRSRVTITGVALATPLGNNPETVWCNAVAGRSGIVPLKLLTDDPPDFLHPEFLAGKRSYCGVSAPLTLEIERQDVHLPPHEFRDLSSSTRLTLWLAEQAVADAQLLEAGYAPERIGVFVSQNSGEQASASWDVNLALRVDWLLQLVSEEAHPTPEQIQRLRARLLEGRAQAGAGSMLGRLNCTAAGYICRRFGFSGPSHSTGAACAASMAALFDAWTLLQAGVIDAAVVGGGEEKYAPLPYAEFCAMGALARSAEYAEPRQCSRPFDTRRTGFVPAGGGAMVILEREDLARQRNASCWGFIMGMGASTNAQGLIEPSAAAQTQAILASFRGMDYGPREVELIECHATSTPSGDLEEGRALAEIFGPAGGATLCAFKSQVGHSFGASGLMALVHGLLAMRARTLPLTINHETPDPDIDLDHAGLTLPATAQPWSQPNSGVRRMQVNAFGFGGACYVAQVEEPNNRQAALLRPDAPAFTACPVPESLELDQVLFTTVNLAGINWRAGASQPENRHEIDDLSAAPDETHARALAKRGIYLDASPTQPPLAFICCGQGSVYPGMGRELYDTFPLVRAGMERIAQAADWDMLALLDETDRDRIISTRWQQPYLLMLEYGIAHYLQALGLQPALVCGHSLGELIALCLAGIYTPETACHLINTRGKIMHALESQSRNGTGMISVSTGLDSVEEILRRHPSLSVCNFNTPRQFILGGDVDALDELGRELKQRRIPAARLGVSMAFHHKGMRTARPQSREALLPHSFSPPRVPILSNVTSLPYPADAQGICAHILDLDENPVQWIRCVQRMWEEYGVRHFVEIGPGAVLCGLVEDIKTDALCIPTCRKRKEADALRGAVARLYALGHLRVETLRTVRSHAAIGSSATRAGRQGTNPPLMAETDERIERIMRAIMKATGYERHELDLQMDLRADLGIRSIHFPVLMQELEKQVGQKIGFERLVGVSTIEELAAVLNAVPLSNEKEDVQEEKTPLPVLRFGLDLTPVSADIAPSLFPSTGILMVGPREKTEQLATHLNRPEGLAGTIMTLQEALEHTTASWRPRPSCLVLFCPEPSGPEPWSGLAALTRLLQAHVADNSESSFLLVGASNAAHSRAQAIQSSALFEAMTAILLSAAQEHPTCRFRSVWLDDGIPAQQSSVALLISALFSQDGPLQRVLGNDRLFIPRLRQCNLDPSGTGLPVKRQDVILVSGGTGGIVPYALSELAMLKPRLILLGRSRLESVTSVLENDAWNAVRRGGATVEYHTCDIRDAENLKTILADIKARHGRIDGIIHAAGVSDNGSLAALGQDELLTVMDVKCRGLGNLLACSEAWGVRYAVAFSSLAGWFGSYGQAAYAAANRTMACLMETASVPARVLWLPPISGAGMAENDATRKAMHLKNMDDAWIHCHELGSLIAREILQGQERQVLLSRYLPALSAVASPLAIPEFPEATPFVPVRRNGSSSMPVWLKALALPICESRAEFSWFRDLWIADHRPWPEMDHPLLSAIMELECLFDGARHLAPWRRLSGAFDVSWRIPVFCPEGITREGRILARATETPGVCGASLEIRDVTPSWRRKSTWSEAVQASILLESASPLLSPLWEEEISLENGSTVSMEGMQAFYREKTAFGGRYRVLEHCDVLVNNWGKASMVYPACEDFTIPEQRHAYPVYLLEAAFQLSAIAAARRVLPIGLNFLRFTRHCTAGEQIRVEIRVIKNEKRVAISDAQCRDAAGTVIMTARGITLAEP